MPKINQAGPSYGGVSGQVTNAVGEQFALTDPDGEQDTLSLDAPDQLTPSTGTDADLAGAPDDGGQPVDEEAKPDQHGQSDDVKKAPSKKPAPAPKK